MELPLTLTELLQIVMEVLVPAGEHLVRRKKKKKKRNLITIIATAVGMGPLWTVMGLRQLIMGLLQLNMGPLFPIMQHPVTLHQLSAMNLLTLLPLLDMEFLHQTMGSLVQDMAFLAQVMGPPALDMGHHPVLVGEHLARRKKKKKKRNLKTIIATVTELQAVSTPHLVHSEGSLISSTSFLVARKRRKIRKRSRMMGMELLVIRMITEHLPMMLQATMLQAINLPTMPHRMSRSARLSTKPTTQPVMNSNVL